MIKKYLFLQGVSSPFFINLAKKLIEHGHQVIKINFTGGDIAYWRSKPRYLFNEKPQYIAEFIENIYKKYLITDQVVFGDRRPLHIHALAQAKHYGIRNHVFEEGYLRPYWITLERNGVNARSDLPKNPAWYLEAASYLEKNNLKEMPYSELVEFNSPFWLRAWHDVNYHLAGVLNPIIFPHYRTHAQETAPREYLGYVKRLPRVRWAQLAEHKRLAGLIEKGVHYYFLPLQLNGDMQVRDQHDLFSMHRLIEYVLESFANHAPLWTHLIIKNHPLDIGLVNYPALINSIASKLGVKGRIHYFENGQLETILAHTLGTVTLNSTVGMASLAQACPTVALAEAIYNLKGLTFQEGLDAFWQTTPAPDAQLFQSFRKVILRTTQVNGGFYCPAGIRLASENSAQLLTQEYSPLDSLLRAVNLNKLAEPCSVAANKADRQAPT